MLVFPRDCKTKPTESSYVCCTALAASTTSRHGLRLSSVQLVAGGRYILDNMEYTLTHAHANITHAVSCSSLLCILLRSVHRRCRKKDGKRKKRFRRHSEHVHPDRAVCKGEESIKPQPAVTLLTVTAAITTRAILLLLRCRVVVAVVMFRGEVRWARAAVIGRRGQFSWLSRSVDC